MKSNIKPSTIDKHLIVFNEIKAICDNHKCLHLETLTNARKVSTSPFYSAVKLNYFNKIEMDKYECLVGKFERIHIRRILEYTNNRYKNGFQQLGKNLKHTIKKNVYMNDNIDPDPWNETGMWDNEIKNKEIIKEGNIIPPTFAMVEKYCNERKNDINPAKFISYYEQKKWKIGKDKMKNWKQAIVTWEQKNYNTISGKKLSDYSDQEVIEDLKRRGYTGSVKKDILL